MPRKRYKPEEIVTKLRQVDGLVSQGRALPMRSGSSVSAKCLRDELLNSDIFYTLREAQIIIESWHHHYDTVQPRVSLGYRPPAPEVLWWESSLWIRSLSETSAAAGTIKQ